jgi:hypothetical protein
MGFWSVPAEADPIRVTFVTQAAEDDPVNAGSQSTGFFSFDSGLFPPAAR